MSSKYLLVLLLGVVLLPTSSLADDGKKPPSYKRPPKYNPPPKHRPPTSLDESLDGEKPFYKPPKGKGEQPPSPYYKPPKGKGEKPPPEHKPPPYGHYPGHPPVENVKDSLEPAGGKKKPYPHPKKPPVRPHKPPYKPPPSAN